MKTLLVRLAGLGLFGLAGCVAPAPYPTYGAAVVTGPPPLAYAPPPVVVAPPAVVVAPRPYYRPPVYRPPVYRPPAYRPYPYRRPYYR